MQSYLKSLGRKSVTAEPRWDKFEELSDLSDGGREPLESAVTVTTSKFLKKKPVAAADTTQPAAPSRASVGSIPSKSSALSKVSSLPTRYSTGSIDGNRGKPVLRDSSDSDLDLSLDEDVMADVRALKGGVAAKQPGE